MKTGDKIRMGILPIVATLFLACHSESSIATEPEEPVVSNGASNIEGNTASNQLAVYNRSSQIRDVMADSVFGSYGRLLFGSSDISSDTAIM